MADRVEERFDHKPQRMIGDTAYGTAGMPGWMVDEKGIAPHTPVWDKTGRHDGTFSRSDFEWRGEDNEYRCPSRLSVPRRGGRMRLQNMCRSIPRYARILLPISSIEVWVVLSDGMFSMRKIRSAIASSRLQRSSFA